MAAHGLLQAAERDLQQVVLDIHDGPVQDIFSALSQVHLLRIRPELQAGEAFGLRGMRDRVAIMNGSLEIDSGEDGTSVEVRFPIQ
jgi:hypothetical protein